MARLTIAILISGRGSNMQALIDACRGGDAPADVALVLSNRPHAPGLARAAAAGIATAVVDHRDYRDRASFDAEIDRRLRESRIDLVCLAGFMRLLTDGFVESWRDRMINIHPSLLPAFPGLHTHERALAAGVKVHGCTVHFVTPELDSGPIVIQAAVAVRGDDSPGSLAARVLAQEHLIYPRAARWFLEDRLAIDDGRVQVKGGDAQLV
ncbi:MAG: phosphoribosylglycinamide formyltransferase, partial [Dongiaceae bacterium]